MKIAVPVDAEAVCPSFGRTPAFLLHDTDTLTTTTLENPAAQAEGGAGIQAAQFVVDQGADVLITVRCGQNAADVLHAAGVAIYRADGENAAENLAKFRAGTLSALTQFHAGFHGIR